MSLLGDMLVDILKYASYSLTQNYSTPPPSGKMGIEREEANMAKW